MFSSESIRRSSSVPPDCLIEIFCLLPTKSLLRFKSVSRFWKSLISDYFGRLFLPDGILILQNNQRHDFISLGIDPVPPRPTSQLLNFLQSGFKVLDSRHGTLILLSGDNLRLHILNPVNQIVETDFKYFSGATLVFNPSKSLHYQIVCVREWSEMFKFLIIDFSSLKQADFLIEIYSSVTESWRTCIPDINQTIDPISGVFCYGAVHWLTSGRTTLYYDLKSLKLVEIPMPEVKNKKPQISYFGESRGHLHLIEECCISSVRRNVYEMNKDRSGWFIKYSINLEVLTAEFPDLFRSRVLGSRKWRIFNLLNVLCIVRGLDEEESYMVVHVPGKVFRYRFSDRQVTRIDYLAPARSEYTWRNAH